MILMSGWVFAPALALGPNPLKSAVSSCALLAVLGGSPRQQSWMVGPFTKPAQVNPVITPNPALAWEAYATFNPAAVVKDGKVFLLYRAEDASGEQQIGGHTSRQLCK